MTTTGVLNDASRLVRNVAAPWAGVLVVTLIPLRLLEVLFLTRVAILGSGAGQYGHYLSRLALWVALAFIPASWGRLVFVRACARAAGSLDTGWRDVLRVSPAVLLNYLVVAFAIQIFGIVAAITFVGAVVAALLLGLATATAHIENRPSIVGPFRTMGRFGTRIGPMIGISFVFVVALVATIVNLGIGASAVIWIGSAFPGFDAARWSALLDGRLFDYLQVASALLVLEPYWLAVWVAYLRRAQDRESGDDLAERFRRIASPSTTGRRATDAAVMVMVIVTLLAGVGAARADTVSLADYRTTLVAIDRDVAANRIDAAIAKARALHDNTIATPDGTIHPDASLIAAIEKLRETPGQALGVHHRLETAIDALSAASSAGTIRPDRALLASVAGSQKLDAIAKGGTVGRLPSFSESATEQISRWWKTAIDWLAGKLERIVDFIISLWPRRSEELTEQLHGVSIPVALTALVVLGIVLLLAIHVVRRARRAAPSAIVSESVRESSRDADPLSREAGEWQRYASELARQGRLREAIRAWYHAILVTLYGAGILHYRKGRTNWEYLASIPPAFGWRGTFSNLTREFDREWYGRIQPTADSFDAFADDARRVLHDVERGGKA